VLVVEVWRSDVGDWQAVHEGALPLATTQVQHVVAGYRISTNPASWERRPATYRARVVVAATLATASPPQTAQSIENLVEAC